jgi:hypothetical protein
MYLSNNNRVDIATLNISKIEPAQQTFLVDNPIDAVKQNLVGAVRKQIVVEAPTGSGKSFTTINYTMIELAKQFPHWKVFFFVAPSQENVDDPLFSAKQLDEKYLGNRQIRVYDNKQFTEMVKNKSQPAGDINFFFFTTQFMYGQYGDFVHTNLNSAQRRLPDIIINDEAHRGLGVPDAETTKEDTGVKNNNWDPKWFQMMEQLLLAGSEVIHMTATPTESQKMRTSIGADKYITLPSMPKVREKNVFTKFYYYGSDCNTNDTLRMALKEYKDQVNTVKNLQSQIGNNIWQLMSDKMPQTMPAIILSLGRNNAINGVPYNVAIDDIEDFCKTNKYDLFVSTSKDKYFIDGVRWRKHKLDRMFDGIQAINSKQAINRPLVMVVIESGKMGINIPRLTTAAVCKVPANKLVHNNYSQFVARTCRMPFFRSHDLAIDFIKRLKVSEQDKLNIIDYYTMLNTSFAVLPDNTQLMPLVERFYVKNTFTMDEGRKYIVDGVFKNSKFKDDGYRVSYDRGSLNRMFRKDHCEACKDDACLKLAIEGYVKIYGDSDTEFEKYMSEWRRTLQVDHKDGNRYNNNPDNHVTVCPNIHMLKTNIQQDYLNNYNFESVSYDMIGIDDEA